MPGFWATAGGAYVRLPPPVPPVPSLTVDQAGAALVGGVAALTVVHGGATAVRSKVRARRERRAEAARVAPTAGAAASAAGGDAGDGTPTAGTSATPTALDEPAAPSTGAAGTDGDEATR